MTITEAPPIACALAPGALKERIAWIGALTRDALRSHERRDLVLDLRYAPEAAERVREMVRNEQSLLLISCPRPARTASRNPARHHRAGSCARGSRYVV